MNDETIKLLTECGSAEEFRLKTAVLGCEARFSFDDLERMLFELDDKPQFIKTLVDMISGSNMFDSALVEETRSFDMRLVGAYGLHVNHDHYRRFKIVVHFECNDPSWGWKNTVRYSDTEKAGFDADLHTLIAAVVVKLEKAGFGSIRSVINFRRTAGV